MLSLHAVSLLLILPGCCLATSLPRQQVLLKLHSEVLPALVNPLLLSDFLSHSLDRGGLEGMLALNGIFRLVTRHGLEYPAFYARLYGLITPAAFLHKQRCVHLCS
jgi:U3 small nucleolar RNA-associated protein 19